MPEAFKTIKEVAAAFAHPDYQTSEVYRQQVAQRVEATEGLEGPTEATLIQPRGDNPPIAAQPSWLAGFRSEEEMIVAISHPRYSRDAGYRADVEAAIAASDPRSLGISGRVVDDAVRSTAEGVYASLGVRRVDMDTSGLPSGGAVMVPVLKQS
jgi:capsid assembly protein